MNIKICIWRRFAKIIQQGPKENCYEDSIVVEKHGTNPWSCHNLLWDLPIQEKGNHNHSLNQDSEVEETYSPVGHVDQVFWPMIGLRPSEDQTRQKEEQGTHFVEDKHSMNIIICKMFIV